MTLSTCLVICVACGQAADEKERKELLVPFYERQAADYQFSLDADGEQPLELMTPPVLTWTNAERYMGSVFLWTRAGRPEAIGCIGSDHRPDGSHAVFHEVHSLSTAPLAPLDVGRGQSRWTAEVPGITLSPTADVPAPASSEPLRLTQMRSIAREFHAWMKDGPDTSELRLLTQPLHRYSSPERGVIDGAIFSYVWTKGTDPEVLLILECRDGESGPEWRHAFARFNWRDLWVERDGAEVWRVAVSDGGAGSGAVRGNYFTTVVGTFTPEQVQSASAERPPASTD